MCYSIYGLTGQAQTVFHRLSGEDQSSFDNAVKALKARFEPECKRELYLAEFSTRTRRISENWPPTCNKGLPRLGYQGDGAITHFISNITDSQLSFAVKQKSPKTLDEATTTAMQLESYIITSSRNKPHEAATSSVTHTKSQIDESLMSAINHLSEKMAQLEQTVNTSRLRHQRQTSPRVLRRRLFASTANSRCHVK